MSVGGRLRELHALRPDRMKVVPGADGWPEAYEYTAGGDTVRFAGEVASGVRAILHVKMFHPANDHYGMSPIEAAATAIDIHNTASKWNKALLDNSARPSGALVYSGRDGRMTADQFERLKAELESSYQGAKHAGRPLLLEGGLDWKALSLEPQGHGFHRGQERGGARDRAGAGRAADAARHSRATTRIRIMPGSAARILARHRVAAGEWRTAKAFSAWLAPAWEIVAGIEARSRRGRSADRRARAAVGAD